MAMIERFVRVEHVEALNSKLLLATVANRKMLPFYSWFYEKAMERTRLEPAKLAKHICIVGRRVT
jgi:hypothetical protein